MKEETSDYHKYFATGLRIEVRFPPSRDTIFRDWAIITLLEEDLVELRLSRDVLPEDLNADTGTILDLRLGREGSAYSCRAIVVENHEGPKVTARLIGEVIPDELREFFRIDAYIPIRYRVPEGESAEETMERWRARRSRRPLHQKRPSAPFASAMIGMESGTPRPTPVAANISGSGIRVRIHEMLNAGDLLPMELHLQLDSPLLVDVVGQVVHVGRLRTRKGEPPLYSTALRFLCIDERDRDAVVGLVSSVQLEHLRAMRGGSAGIAELEHGSYTRKTRLRRMVLSVVLIALLSAVLTSLAFLRLKGQKGEIEQTYEREIKKYRTIFPWH